MIISLIWSVHQWTRLCPRLLSTSWNKTDKMIWIFHGYIQIDISVLHTPSVYWSQDISLSIYDDDFMFVIRYPKDSLLQLYTRIRNVVCTWNDRKKKYLTYSHSHRKKAGKTYFFGFHFGSMKDWASVYLRIPTLTLL